MQFFLAAKGYNVISYDYSSRKILYRAKNIFNISYKHDQTNYKHDYISDLRSQIIIDDKKIKNTDCKENMEICSF